jgi:hypothetical protein
VIGCCSTGIEGAVNTVSILSWFYHLISEHLYLHTLGLSAWWIGLMLDVKFEIWGRSGVRLNKWLCGQPVRDAFRFPWKC